MIKYFLISNIAFFFYDREGSKVSHYIINVTQEPSQSIYKIGDKTFSSMKELLTFYKQRLLDTSPLVRIVSYLIN
jgi:hypothetical protein